jgi:hypothetical protein
LPASTDNLEHYGFAIDNAQAQPYTILIEFSEIAIGSDSESYGKIGEVSAELQFKGKRQLPRM